MKKIIAIIFACIIAAPAAAANPFFGETQNQVGLQFGQSVGGGKFLKVVPGNDWEPEPFQAFIMQYSQPFEFFRLPGRQNLHLGWLAAYYDMAEQDYNNPIAGISWDAMFFKYHGFYAGAGLGAYIKLSYYDRQDSLFMFGSKFFVGYRMFDTWSAEIYTQHFDNAALTPIDGGYNFFGIQLFKNF